jgi:hypothetical protein
LQHPAGAVDETAQHFVPVDACVRAAFIEPGVRRARRLPPVGAAPWLGRITLASRAGGVSLSSRGPSADGPRFAGSLPFGLRRQL